uniref:Uncharacterized protein n=1 Tax=Chromera velia CCMP2878 TaxID=1169474 RepID=A0A0G4FTX3_9ALVE|eukprot:Cvel_18626.t1-p1 / transcript=Cvel_18626.t1 / gene=Cvel_18626 / organism=Chromera_velia_CCMP2878 / gene_product=hypothetical protein / transcript_product=hypothetical protein / location=Cvel_scaffold1555:12016-15497(-) / protein_length=299 / sequence_SO=supercontig / SO=protein_coding / is_pseudo=false
MDALHEAQRGEALLSPAGINSGEETGTVQPQGEGEEIGEKQTRDDGLFVFLQHLQYLGLTSEALADLAKERDSFGFACLDLFLFQKARALGKVSVDALRGSIDISGTNGLSARNLFLFLDFLPSSVEELKLDSLAVKGRALPRFVRFLQRVQAARSGVGEAPHLKNFIFAQNSIGSTEAGRVFPLLLPSLEFLCLKGNPLGIPGIRAVAEGIRDGKAVSLRNLDLEDTGLNQEGVEILCRATEDRGLKVERDSESIRKSTCGRREPGCGGRRALCVSARNPCAVAPKVRALGRRYSKHC